MIAFDWGEKIQNWVFKSWLETKGAGVKIAVLDTGADLNHPCLTGLDLAGHKINVAVTGFDPGRPQDFSNADVTDRHQQQGHGTQCLSVLAATPAGQDVLSGITQKAEIFIIKVNTLDHKFFLVKDFLKGLEAAARLQVDIVISSICFPKEDLEDENIPVAEIERVFGLLNQSGALLFAALPNVTPLISWVGLAAGNFPNFRPEAINSGAISAQIYNKRKLEISALRDVHFAVSDATGVFCKIENAFSTEKITSSHGVYVMAGIAALCLAAMKKREKENYQPRAMAELVKAMSKQFKTLATSNEWDTSQPVIFKTNIVDGTA